MKIQSILLLAGLATALNAVQADPIIADSNISEVALYRDSALITRQATIAVPAGKTIIRVENLPRVARQNTLQALFTAPSEGVIRNASLYTPKHAEEPENIEALRERIQDKQDERKAIEQHKQAAQEERDFAQSMAKSLAKRFGEIGEGDSLTIEQAKQAWAYVSETRERAEKTTAEADEEIRAIDEAIEDLSKELKEALQRFAQLNSVAEVEVELPAAAEIDIAIRYLVGSANWQPQYELRATPSVQSLKFGYFATIWQNTGEDWVDATVSLQTNMASQGGNAPELRPVRVNKRGDYRSYGESPPPADRAMKLSLSESSFASEAEISASTVAFAATLPGKTTILSQQQGRQIKSITEEELEAEFWSEASPKLDLNAYLKAKSTNAMELPILPGQALAFVDGALSSKVWLQKILPEEELEVSLGVDANITVKRREGASQNASTGFIDKTTTLRREFFNEVASYHVKPHRVVVVDQFPLSANSKIEIRRQSPSASQATFDEEDNGIFRWDEPLEPKEERSFKTAYEVIYPRDWEITPKL